MLNLTTLDDFLDWLCQRDAVEQDLEEAEIFDDEDFEEEYDEFGD